MRDLRGIAVVLAWGRLLLHIIHFFWFQVPHNWIHSWNLVSLTQIAKLALEFHALGRPTEID